MTKNKMIIFDLDGTLYRFKGGSFVNSGLQKIVLTNALKYIQLRLNKNYRESKTILKKIQSEYGEDISVAMQEKYNCSRKDYFDFVWDIQARGIIEGTKSVDKMLSRLSKRYKLLLVSDGARKWIDNALEELGLTKFFKENILSGDGKRSKSRNNRFNVIAEQYKILPKNIISIGDQEKTDIIPSKKCGFKTIYIGENKSQYADITINSILECERAINKIDLKR